MDVRNCEGLKKEHADTPVEATSRRSGRLPKEDSEGALRKDRRHLENSGIRKALNKMDSWRDVYKHVHPGPGSGTGNGPKPETCAEDLRQIYEPDAVGGGEEQGNLEPALFDCSGEELKRAVNE